MPDLDDDPLAELAATMGKLRAVTARRRLLRKDSSVYADAYSEEMQLNDRIMQLVAERDSTDGRKAG